MISLLYPWICFDMAEGEGGGGSDTGGGGDTGGGAGGAGGAGAGGGPLLNPDLTPADITIPAVQYIPPDTPPCPGCGCMDNGNMPNTYQNNFGTLGSLTPPYAAYNYDPAATVDDGTCRYQEVWNACGCNDPLSLDFIGQEYQNGYGMPGTSVSWSPDWNLHPGFFTDCVGNVRNSVPYLAIGPHGDTSCCEQPDDHLYNYRDLFWRPNKRYI